MIQSTNHIFLPNRGELIYYSLVDIYQSNVNLLNIWNNSLTIIFHYAEIIKLTLY